MGIEPTTPGATVQCSNQLSYGHRAKPQGPNRTGALAQRLAFHLPRRRAAVDDDRLARHPGRRIGREEDARVRDLLDLAPASHADARGDRVVRLLAVRPRLLEHVQVALGLHRPRRDAVHANALASPGGAELACERDDAGLGGPVVRHHGGAVDAGDRRKIDDGTAGRLLHHLAPGPLQPRNAPVRLMPTTVFQPLAEMSSGLARNDAPALFTMMSSRPHSWTTRSTIPLTCSS